MKVLKVLLILAVLTIALQSSRCPWRQSRNLALSFKYAASTGAALKTSSFFVKWNGRVIKRITPTSYRIFSIFNLRLLAKAGNNRLEFHGAGGRHIKGVTIDDVRVVRPGQEVGKHY